VLGACLYIAQLNLGIEEAGLNVKRICDIVGCSSEELAKWSQLLKGLILMQDHSYYHSSGYPYVTSMTATNLATNVLI